MKLISEAQLEANRQNAQKSCGPTSAAGRETSSYNHTIHGLAGEFRVMPGESQAKFDRMLGIYFDEHNPATLTEYKLVERMAEHQWLVERAIRLQNGLWALGLTLDEHEQKQFALYIRYQTTHERAHSRCLADLLKLKAERRKVENGFESQKRAEAAQARAATNETRREAHEIRRAAAEKRTQELHQFAVLTAEAKLSREQSLAGHAETEHKLLQLRNPELKTAQTAA